MAAVCATSSCWVLLWTWGEPTLPQTEEMCRANLFAVQITVTALCLQQLLKHQHSIVAALWEFAAPVGLSLNAPFTVFLMSKNFNILKTGHFTTLKWSWVLQYHPLPVLGRGVNKPSFTPLQIKKHLKQTHWIPTKNYCTYLEHYQNLVDGHFFFKPINNALGSHL